MPSENAAVINAVIDANKMQRAVFGPFRWRMRAIVVVLNAARALLGLCAGRFVSIDVTANVSPNQAALDRADLRRLGIMQIR